MTTNDIKEVCAALDATEIIDDDTPSDNNSSEVERIRKELTRVYKQIGKPDKVDEVPELLEKYRGKEQALLESVYKKYRPSRSFVLRRITLTDENKSYKSWNLEQPLANVQNQLDRIAQMAGGQLKWKIVNSRFEKGKVQRLLLLLIPSGYSLGEGQIQSLVTEARDIVRSRFHPKSSQMIVRTERERRVHEKTKSLNKRAGRQSYRAKK